MVSALLLAASSLAAAGSRAAAPFEGRFFSGSATGSGDELGLLDTARRSLGEPEGGVADVEIQSMPMLYSGGEDGLLEGPTWGAYWTQVRHCAPRPAASPSPAALRRRTATARA